MSTLVYRPEIDGLRAVAVLAVVLYHAGLGGAGYVGVDVFFVISGYLITALLLAEQRTAGRIDLFGFYARRVRRLLPALVLVIATTVIAASVLLSPYGEVRAVTRSAVASLLFLANVHFQGLTGGYFDGDADRMPLLHLWSLGVEEQFYVIWPLLLIGLSTTALPRTRLYLGILILASLLFAEYCLHALPQSVAFYQMPARFWELGIGGAIATWPARCSSRTAPIGLLGLGVVLIAVLVPVAHFPALGALPAVAGAGLIVGAVHLGAAPGLYSRLLASPLMVGIGLISYSLYLWHWPLLALARATHAEEPPAALRAGLCLLAVVLAAATYRCVERPLRRSGAGQPARKVVVGGVAMSLSLATAAWSLGTVVDRPPPPTDLASRTARDQPFNRGSCNYRGIDDLTDVPRAGCIHPQGLPVRVAIWGDSHALAWQAFAWTLAETNDVASATFVRDACPPVLEFDNGKRAVERDLCMAFNARVAAAVIGVDTLVIASRWPRGERHAAFSAAFESTLAQLAPRVRRILLLGPTPELRHAAPHCLRHKETDVCAVPRSEHAALTEPTRRSLAMLARRHANVEYVDLTDFFCNAEICPPARDGYGLFWDTNHVTTTAATRFARSYLARTQLGAARNEAGHDEMAE